MVLIPFHQASQSDEIDDTHLLSAQQNAGAAVRLFIKLGKIFQQSEEERQVLAKEVGEIFKSKGVTESRILRTYTILLFFSIKVCQFICTLYAVRNEVYNNSYQSFPEVLSRGMRYFLILGK